MGSKVEKIEVALSQHTPFEDEVVELAPKFISAEAVRRLRPRAAEAAATARPPTSSCLPRSPWSVLSAWLQEERITWPFTRGLYDSPQVSTRPFFIGA